MSYFVMHSVILTELGIAVFDEQKCLKTFPFENPAEDFVNDRAVLDILKKKSIEAQLMNDQQTDKIQSSKTKILVDSGFAEDENDAMEKLREFAIQLSSSKVSEVSESTDLHIIQAINTLDETDKIINNISSRLREWYGLHFPELDNLIDSINGYSPIVVSGKRENISKKDFEKAGFPESKVEMLSLVKEKSRGGKITDKNLTIVQTLANQILELFDLRNSIEEHVNEQMKEEAPNISAILGTAVGARILSRAGSLKKLASMPAAPRWQRGKMARTIAAKAAIAARVDVYKGGLNETLLDKLNIRVKEIEEKHKEPPVKKELKSEPTVKRKKSGRFMKRKRKNFGR